MWSRSYLGSDAIDSTGWVNLKCALNMVGLQDYFLQNSVKGLHTMRVPKCELQILSLLIEILFTEIYPHCFHSRWVLRLGDLAPC